MHTSTKVWDVLSETFKLMYFINGSSHCDVHLNKTFVTTMKKLILFQFLCGLFNYGSAQTVYSAPNVCMNIPIDLNRLVRNLFLEGFIAFKRDIAKTTAAQNTMNALDACSTSE